jgi:ADP-dependent NAD(P)H-hydrate dehydratase
MSTRSEGAGDVNGESDSSGIVTADLLRSWPLPSGGDSKYARGRLVVVGGARRTPGAVLLAGTAALRVGAGRVMLGVAGSVAEALAVAMPESGVIGLPETDAGSVRGIGAGALADQLADADAVLIGSGLDDPAETKMLIRELLGAVGDNATVVLDAYALGVLAELTDELRPWAGRLALTPNTGEAERLLGRGIRHHADDLAEIAERYQAVVTSFGVIAAPDGRRWQLGSGQAVLSTAGSGDVLAGAVAGLLARGASPEQATCWGSHLHATAGDRLAGRIGPTGVLARELADELPVVLAELGQRA